MIRRFILISFCILLCACGTALSGIRPEGTQYVVPSPILTQELDTTPSPTEVVPIGALPRPATRLGETVLGTFDAFASETVFVGGRYYTVGQCMKVHCEITLWPDNTKIWVRKEDLNIETTPQVLVLTPGPAEYDQHTLPQAQATVWAHNTEVALQRTADAAGTATTQ